MKVLGVLAMIDDDETDWKLIVIDKAGQGRARARARAGARAGARARVTIRVHNCSLYSLTVTPTLSVTGYGLFRMTSWLTDWTMYEHSPDLTPLILPHVLILVTFGIMLLLMCGAGLGLGLESGVGSLNLGLSSFKII